MADRKWSALDPTTIQGTDIVALARGAASNWRWSFDDLLMWLTSWVLRRDTSSVVAEVGYPATPTVLTPAGNTVTPTIAGNGSYRVAAAHADVLTIDMSGETGEGALSVYIPAGTTGRTLSPAATVTEGTPTASVAQWLYWERVGTSTLAVWLGE